MEAKCTKCDNNLEEVELYIIEAPCWHCQSNMKVAVKSIEGEYKGPDEFTVEELDICKAKGVVTRLHFSNPMGMEYLANSCESCGTFVGKWFLYSDLFLHGPIWRLQF